jgi:metallo-beta-lactamase family protein
VKFHRWHRINEKMDFRLQHAGHIIGAASIEIRCGGVTTLFSGDLGRPNDAIMQPPDSIEKADYLICESTYGNRLHSARNPEDTLAEAVAPTIAAGGTVLIPAFAVGRSQSLLYYLDRLKKSGRLPASLPVYLDSPMAQDASDIFVRHPADHRLTEQQCRDFCSGAIYVRDADASKALTQSDEPKVILSASGMATGGRILHHLKRYAPDPRNTIIFAGFQAGGTRGAAMLGGATTIKIHGDYIPVRARVTEIEELSAHADGGEIMTWLKQSPSAPRKVFITHGEPSESDGLRHRIEEELHWNCVVPEFGQTELLS